MNFVQNELQQCKKNSSKWEAVRNCVPWKESTQPAYSRDLKTLADKFNEFFTSVGAKAAADSASLLSDFNDFELFSAQQLYPDSEQFQFCAVSMREIRKIVMSFPSHKAPGCDKVPIQIIKDALPCILPLLTDILNHSLLSPVFPQDWKISEIIPLLKEGDHEVANNKGPISLLPAASKVCERVALIHFTQFMKAKKHLTEHQSINKAMHSTETMKVMTDQMLQVIDGKKLSIRQYRPQ